MQKLRPGVALGADALRQGDVECLRHPSPCSAEHEPLTAVCTDGSASFPLGAPHARQGRDGPQQRLWITLWRGCAKRRPACAQHLWITFSFSRFQEYFHIRTRVLSPWTLWNQMCLKYHLKVEMCNDALCTIPAPYARGGRALHVTARAARSGQTVAKRRMPQTRTLGEGVCGIRHTRIPIRR